MSKILIRDGVVLTPGGWLNPGYLLVDGEKVLTVEHGMPPIDITADQTLSVPHMAVIPGLINSHSHLSQTFMRGLAGGRPLIKWLKERIWPLQSVMTADELHLASLLGLVENLCCGMTSVIDHHKVTTTTEHTNALCRAALMSGLEVTIARSWVDYGTNAESPESIVNDLNRLFDQWHGTEGRISIANGPLATWRCSAQMLKKSHELVKKYDSFSHIHLSETSDEVKMCLDTTGERPVNWLESLGVLDENMQLVHAVWIDEGEMDLLAQRSATVIHCPVSNAVLGSGIAPLTEIRKRGIRVRLGTDGSASSDNQDIWEVIKASLAFSRASTLDPTIISPSQALEMALCEKGIIIGMMANISIIDLNQARVMPVNDPTSALVLCCNGGDVDTVIVRGKLILHNKHVLVVDKDTLLKECRVVVNGLFRRAGLDYLT